MEQDGQALTLPRPRPSSSYPDDREVAGLIARLLLHFWAPSDLSEAARKAMAADWVDDLREFGADVLSVACGDWRRSHSKRPTPAEIRQLCIAEQNRRREHDDNLRLPPPNRAAYAERNRHRLENLAREGRDICNRWAQERGYADFSTAEADGKKHSDVIKSIAAAPKEMQRERHTANRYVTVTERPQPTPERMAADRAKLGIEEPV